MSGNLRYTKQLISELECYASLGAPRSATSGALRSGDEITQMGSEGTRSVCPQKGPTAFI